MQHSGSRHHTLTLRLTLTVSLFILFILAVSFFSQQTTPTRIPASETLSPSPTASLTPSPTVTLTPTPTRLPPTRTLENISPTQLFTLGRGIISSIARSPDGRLIAYIDGSTLKWFDAETYQQIGEIYLQDIYDPIVFSPDSRLIAVGAGYWRGALVDLEKQHEIGFDGGSGFTFSPDGHYIASRVSDWTSAGPYDYIIVWDVTRQERIDDHLPTLFERRLNQMSIPAISTDSRLVAAGCSDDHVYVWDIENGESRFILEGHAGDVVSVDFSPDGRYLASGSADGTVRLWSPGTGQLVRVITGFLDNVTWVEFTEDSRQLRIGVRKQADQAYDLNSGQLVPWDEPEQPADPFAAILYAQGYIENGMTTRVAFSPDGSSLALGRGSILVWDVAAQELITSLDVSRSVVWITYSPDGRWLGVINEAGDVLVWDTSSWELLLSLSTEILPLGQVFYGSGLGLSAGIGAGVLGEQGFAFSPDGARLVVGNGMAVEVWDIQSAALLYTLEEIELSSYATRLSYSPDGQRIYAVLNRNREAAIWDANSGALIDSIDLPAVDLNAFTTTDLNGALFARNNSDGQTYWIEIWNLDTGELVRVDSPGRETEPLRFSPDGSLLLSVNADRLYVWMSDSGDLIYRSGAEFAVGGLALNPDNRWLAIGSYGVAEMWDTSGIAERVQGTYIPTVAPLPTETPRRSSWPTETPMPTIPITPLPLPDLPDGAISSANAAQVDEVGRFGAGGIKQVSWTDNSHLLVAASLGVDQYRLNAAGVLFGEPTHYATDLWITSSVSLADGRSLAAGTDGQRVQVWELVSGETLVDLEGGGEPALSPDGRMLVYLGEDGNLHIWDLVAGEPGAILLPASSYPGAPVFSPDSRLVAAIAGNYTRSAIRVWDAATGVIVNALGGPDSDITDLSFSPDGRRIVAAAGGSAWVWDIRPGQPPIITRLYEGVIDWNLTLYVHTVTAAALSPSGWTLAVGTSENTINLYSLGNQSPTRLLSGHSAPVEKLAFSPDGRTLLSLDADGALLLWNVSTGELVEANYSHYGEIRGLIFQENGSLIGWQAGTTWTFDPAAGEVLHTTRITTGNILAVSPRGDWLAATYPYQVSLYDAVTGEFRQTLEGEAPKPFVEYFYEGEMFQGYHGAAFSPDGSVLVTLGSGGASIYNTQDGSLVRSIEGDNAQQADISMDNRWLLTSLYVQWASPDMVDLQSGEMVFSLDGSGYQNIQYRLSPDNRWIGVTFRSAHAYQFQLWDFASHTMIQSLDFSPEIPLLSLAFSPDARLVALGQANGQIFLVDLSTFQVVATLTGHRGAVERLAFSPSGRYLASGGQDGTIRIWGIP
jgi:WD40 repeat protein